jgi:hypothetical protein
MKRERDVHGMTATISLGTRMTNLRILGNSARASGYGHPSNADGRKRVGQILGYPDRRCDLDTHISRSLIAWGGSSPTAAVRGQVERGILTQVWAVAFTLSFV